MTEPAALRLIFDENMSTRVAKAPTLLDLQVSYVGARGHPPTGSSDEAIAEFARHRGGYIFTQNYDMVMASADAGVGFVWFDNRGRALTLFDTAVIFRQWPKWEAALATGGVECLKVGRRMIFPLTAAEGRAEAAARYEKQQARAQRATELRERGDNGELPLEFPDGD